MTAAATDFVPTHEWPGYEDLLDRARARSGKSESVTVEIGTVGGLEVVFISGHFAFLGGSMGRVHGDRVVAAFDLAVARGIPVVAHVASGGARTQEGVVALTQMARTAAAVQRLRSAGLPFIAHFQHPTTGGVHASYAASADVIIADAGATVGFVGPRVVAALSGTEVSDSHTAEVALERGLVDEVVPADGADEAVARWVDLLHPRRRASAPRPGRPDPGLVVEYDPWEALQRARGARPGVRELLPRLCDAHAELRGDRAGTDDPVVVTAVARLAAAPVMVIGTDRNAVADGGLRGQPGAAGFRKAARAVRLAERWSMPVLTLIDTVGADPRSPSDRSGLVAAMADCAMALHEHSHSSLAVILGEGGSGGAMALASTRRLAMQDDAVLEVIAPEGAAAIIYRDPVRAAEIMPRLRATAWQVRDLGFLDEMLPGPTGISRRQSVRAVRAAAERWLLDPNATTHQRWFERR